MTHSPATRIQHTENLVARLTDLISSYLIKTEQDKFESKGRAVLAQQLSSFIAQRAKVKFVLPGFPCKSPNTQDKSFSCYPDYGEVIAIERLQALCDDIKDLYQEGAELVIVSDGTTFSDLVHVEETTREQYNARLKNLTVTHDIQWANLEDLIGPEEYAGGNNDKIRKQLLKVVNKGSRSFENFIKAIRSDPEQAAVHDKLCSYLYHDIALEAFSSGDRDAYLDTIADKAYHMMYRGRALSKRIEARYPEHIRLSVHQYDNAGPKFTFSLCEDTHNVRAPWHTVPVLRADASFTLLPHSIAKQTPVALVTHQQNNWMYLQLPSEDLNQFSYEVIQAPRFGLKISSPLGASYDILPADFLQGLSRVFGFVLLENAALEDQQALLNFTQPFGAAFHWEFGPVHVVKPEDKPEGFIYSLEKTPLHWDLSMLPGSHPNAPQDLAFAIETFFLYCKTPPAPGEGQTTLVDNKTVLQLAGRTKVDLWSQQRLSYFTKLTYFGGEEKRYPLVMQHPRDNTPILRYQEASQLDIQTFTISSDSLPDKALKALTDELDNLVYDPRCVYAHQWKANDMIIVNNHYTLHGRLPMTENSKMRELWRVQVTQ